MRAVSAQVQAKAAKVAGTATGSTTSTSASSGGSDGAKYSNALPSVVANGSGSGGEGGASANGKASNANAADSHETKVKEGTAKRNIVRKKTSGSDSGNYNSCHKKQGGHGKGQWKDNMDPSYVEAVPVDEKDPLYDELDGKFILSSATTTTTVAADPANGVDPRGYDPGTSKAVYGPMLTETEFKHQVGLAVLEYFDSADSEEFIRNLLELKCEEYSASVVKKAISLALDKGPRERESVSRLLTVLHPIPLADTEMERGFTILLDSLDDLQTDVPEANVSTGRVGHVLIAYWTCGLTVRFFVLRLTLAANDRVLLGPRRG